MRPENVEFIAAYGPGEPLLGWHVESRVCRSIGKEDPAVIPAPDLHPILGRCSPPRAVRLPGFYTVDGLAGRRFGNRADEVSRKRLIAAGSLAVVGGVAIDDSREGLIAANGFAVVDGLGINDSRERSIAGGVFAEVDGLPIDGVLAEGVDRNTRDGPQQQQRLGNMHGYPERTSGDLCAS